MGVSTETMGSSMHTSTLLSVALSLSFACCTCAVKTAVKYTNALPAGAYKGSCKGCSSAQGMLVCRGCLKGNQKYGKATRIRIGDCVSFDNSNGQLNCDFPPQKQQQQKSASPQKHQHQHQHHQSAEQREEARRQKQREHDKRQQPDRRIHNNNLWIDSHPKAHTLPVGSYRSSCYDCSEAHGQLVCKNCRRTNRKRKNKTKASSIEIGDCVDIGNSDGKLICNQRETPQQKGQKTQEDDDL